MFKRTSKVFLLAFMVVLVAISCKNESGEKGYKEISYFTINADGDLERPQDYRTWIYVGTPVTPNDMNNGKAAFPEMHNVYMDPASYNHWKKTGVWREGTILIKELVSVGTKAAVSGNGYFMGEFIGLEATIKSAKHFPDEPGNWAYFSFTNPGGDLKDTGTAFKTNQCNACHNANAADDFVFTQHYPVLTAAKGVGENVVPENAARRKAAQAKAFSHAGVWDAMAPTPEGLTLDIPLSKEHLFAYLESGKYKEAFTNKEKEAHPSLGPHTQLGLPVRVFMNDIIAESLKNGNEEHPLGSVIVKEMFTKDNVIAGWAVMAKTQDTSDEGNGWFWYEVTDAKDATKIAAIGNGVEGCISCHSIGRDMVRTSFPLK